MQPPEASVSYPAPHASTHTHVLSSPVLFSFFIARLLSDWGIQL